MIGALEVPKAAQAISYLEVPYRISKSARGRRGGDKGQQPRSDARVTN